jgi:hypothetical protein
VVFGSTTSPVLRSFSLSNALERSGLDGGRAVPSDRLRRPLDAARSHPIQAPKAFLSASRDSKRLSPTRKLTCLSTLMFFEFLRSRRLPEQGFYMNTGFKSGWQRAGITRRQQDAIAALLNSWTVEEAARTVGIGSQILRRWMNKDRNFIAAYNAAQDAEYARSMARLRQEAPSSAAMLLKVTVEERGRPTTKLRAAILLLGHAQDAIEIDKFRVEVTELERARQASETEAGRLSAGVSGKSGIVGHGAKFPRRMQKAIAALLTEPSVAQAAGVAGVGYQTLLRWPAEPAFLAAYGAAAGAAFASAVRILRRGVDTAISTVSKLSKNLAVPAATRAMAADYLFSQAKAGELKDLAARMAALEPGNTGDGSSEPERTFENDRKESPSERAAAQAPLVAAATAPPENRIGSCPGWKTGRPHIRD